MQLQVFRAVCIVAGVICASGCGNSSGPKESHQEAAQEPRATRISGRVVWKGAVPPEKELAVWDERIVQIREGRPIFSEFHVVGPDGGLANVFIWVVGKLAIEIPPAPAEPVILRMEGGVYVPHVIALRVGQTVHVQSSSAEIHNPHFMAKLNPEFGFAARRAGDFDYKFGHAEIIKAKCDVHGSMSAWIGVFDNPWFAVTGTDGRFELKGLPPGKYHLKAWHEKGGIREADVEIPSDDTEAHADFEFGPE